MGALAKRAGVHAKKVRKYLSHVDFLALDSTNAGNLLAEVRERRMDPTLTLEIWTANASAVAWYPVEKDGGVRVFLMNLENGIPTYIDISESLERAAHMARVMATPA
jgi:hypothetical protein